MIWTARQFSNKVVNEIERRFDRTRLLSKPQVVDVVLTKACNLACTFCKDYETEGAQRLSLENFNKAAEQLFPTAVRLSICSGGEPYLHKGLEEILRIGKRHRLFTWVLSNGMLLPEERMRTILEEGLISRHGFSVDGIEAATVEGIRIKAKLETIIENIQRLIRLRDSLGKEKPRITIRFALMRSNIDELPKAIETWAKIGVDRLDCGYLSLANEIDPNECLFYHQEHTEAVFREARKAAAKAPALEVNLPNLVREEAAKEKNPSRCESPWNFVLLDTNGYVLPCYRAFEAIAMGKLYDDDGIPFDQVWNSPDYQALRATVNDDSKKKHYPYCSVCEMRYGWGSEQAHLGDSTWVNTLNEDGDDLIQIDHRRSKPKKRSGSGQTAVK